MPIIKSLGLLITLKKSRPVNPNPRPNIIRARAIGAILVTTSTFYPYINNTILVFLLI